MKLTELEPQFLRMSKDDPNVDEYVDALANADGIMFLCPKCLAENGGSSIGVHSIICWFPQVPLTRPPGPGRWEALGTGFADLTFRAGSSSVLLTSGCHAHFLITNGEIVFV